MNSLKTDRLKSAVKYIDNWLEFNYKDSRLPGFVVAIQHEDNLLLNNAYGYADTVNKVPMKPIHVFRIASHSKTFTATAIMQLYEAGKLRLDDKISEHLPWFISDSDEEVENITIRQFLNHSSGLIRDGVDANYWQLDGEFPTESELKDFVKNAKLHPIKTNEYFKYSNFAYSFLGQVIEAVSGSSYVDFVKENIINKVGLTDTYPDLCDEAEAKLATGHTPILFNSKRELLKHSNTNGMAAATGFCSTAADLCKYFLTHCYENSSLISDASKREMQHGYWLSEKDDEAYGLGMAEYRHKSGNLYGHGGGFPGFITNTRFNPKEKLVVSVMTNAWDGPAQTIAKQIIKIINYFQNHQGDEENLARFEGRFFGKWYIMDVVNVNGKLVSSKPRYWGALDDNTAEELTVMNENTLLTEKTDSFGSPGEEIIYSFASDGSVNSVIATGMKMLPEKSYIKSLKTK